MVTYDEFNRFQSENTAQHAELNGKIERLAEEVRGLKTEVAVLAERTNGVRTAQDLTNRLLVAMLGVFGVMLAGFIASFFAR